MLSLRWKWIGYHAYSSVFVAGFSLFISWLGLLYFDVSLQATEIVIISLVVMTGSIILGLIFGFQFSKNLRNKLEEVTIGVRALAYGDLDFRLNFTDDKDVGSIATAFNEMADRIEQQVTSLQKLAKENEELVVQTKSAAITEERQRLARDLHDAVSQQLFAISLASSTALRVLEQDLEQGIELIKNIEFSATRAQSEMRALLLQLRPEVLQDKKLNEAIGELANELETKMSLTCKLELTDIVLPNHVENHLYRVIQEALANVLRHSQATTVQIKLQDLDQSQRAKLTIEDNGVGFDPKAIPQTSYGIQSIKERIGELGGTADWISIPQKGTRLEVRVPIIRRVDND